MSTPTPLHTIEYDRPVLLHIPLLEEFTSGDYWEEPGPPDPDPDGGPDIGGSNDGSVPAGGPPGP